MRGLLIFIAALALASSAAAADLTVTVKTPAGRAVRDAVVTVYPSAGFDRSRIRFSWPYRMSQHDMRFDPFVLIVPVGAEVSFPNLDTVRHHVYSFSPAKTFELKLYGSDQTRAVRFDRVGVAAIGCNIHDAMVAYINVVDTPFAAKTDANGQAVFRGLPAGQARVRTWHPYAKVRGAQVEQAIVAAAAGAQSLAVGLDLRAAPVRHGGY